MLEKLMNNPYAWAILSILTIVSFGYAIFTQHINKEKKEFSYIQKSNSLIRKKRSKFEKISVMYDGQQIDDLCVSKFTIWNSGNKTLNSNDMVESKELTITALEDNRILDVELTAYSEETNKFNIKIIDEHTAKIFFEYADKKDGVVIQIMHTGTKDVLQVECKIKGGKSIKNIINETVPKRIRNYIKQDKFEKILVMFSIFTIVLFFVMAIASTVAIFNSDLRDNLFFPREVNGVQFYKSQTRAVICSIIYWIFSATMSFLYIPIIKNHFGIGIPKLLKNHSGFID